jgi:hypothetical protein
VKTHTSRRARLVVVGQALERSSVPVLAAKASVERRYETQLSETQAEREVTVVAAEPGAGLSGGQPVGPPQ